MLHAWLRENYTERFLRAAALCDDADTENNFAMLNSSAYLFKSRKVNFAVDLETLEVGRHCDVSKHLGKIAEKLSFMLITHGHVDHFEEQSVGLMRGRGMKWVIPDFLVGVAHSFGLTDEEIIVIRDRETICIEDVEITAFASAHFRPITRSGMDEYGYYIHGDGLPRILIPGDIRDYSVDTLPGREFAGKCDVLFAHIWLGDGRGRGVEFFPYDTQLAIFIEAYSPKKVVYGHIFKSGRNDDGMWRREHAMRICDVLRLRGSEIQSIVPKYGEIFRL